MEEGSKNEVSERVCFLELSERPLVLASLPRPCDRMSIAAKDLSDIVMLLKGLPSGIIRGRCEKKFLQHQ
jgi:hypothetical protein